MRDVTLRAVARRQPPGIGAVAVEVLGICYRIRTIYQSDVAVVFKIGRCIVIAQAVRIKAEIRVMREK